MTEEKLKDYFKIKKHLYLYEIDEITEATLLQVLKDTPNGMKIASKIIGEYENE